MSKYQHNVSSTQFDRESHHKDEDWKIKEQSALCATKNVADETPSRQESRRKERTPSVEFFNPPAESHLRRTSLFAATFNMVATIIGGGILSIPLSFQKTGLVLGTILMIIAAVTTSFSLYILCSCSRRSGASSYGGVARVAFGPGLELFTTLLLFVFLVFVIIAYMVLVKNIWTPIVMTATMYFTKQDAGKEDQSNGESYDTTDAAEEISGNLQDWEDSVLLVILILLAPFLLKQDLHSLRHNCYVGFVSITILCLATIYRACERNIENPSLFSTNTLWFTSSFADALFAYPIIMLAFMCSFNIISVHGALVNPSRERVRKVIDRAVMASFALTYIFGLAGYFYAYNDTDGNILLNFDPSDKLIFTGRIGCGFTIMMAMPMILVPCRDSLLSLPEQYNTWANDKTHDNQTSSQSTISPKVCDTEATPLIAAINAKNQQKDDTDSEEMEPGERMLPQFHESHHRQSESNSIDGHARSTKDIVIHVVTTLVIVSVAYIAALKAPGVAVVWSICGSSMAFLISFILPTACYIKLRHVRKGHTHRIIGLSWILFVASVFGALACTVQTVWRLFFMT